MSLSLAEREYLRRTSQREAMLKAKPSAGEPAKTATGEDAAPEKIEPTKTGEPGKEVPAAKTEPGEVEKPDSELKADLERAEYKKPVETDEYEGGKSVIDVLGKHELAGKVLSKAMPEMQPEEHEALYKAHKAAHKEHTEEFHKAVEEAAKGAHGKGGEGKFSELHKGKIMEHEYKAHAHKHMAAAHKIASHLKKAMVADGSPE